MIIPRFWHQTAFALLLGSAACMSASAQILNNFVAVTPCRVVDTRVGTGNLAGPILTAQSTRSFPLPTSTACTIPTNAAAYSLNVTVVPTASLTYLTIWPTGSSQPVVSTLNDLEGTFVANAAIVPAGSSGAVSVYVSDQTHVVIDINGYFLASNNSTTGNTSVGQGALPVTQGAQNTAVGAGSLGNNSGDYNVGIGTSSLLANSTGSQNTAVGQTALLANTTGTSNTAIGYQALESVTTQSDNVAVGVQALSGSTGASNIALGYQAGINISTGSNNIDIGSNGLPTDSGIIRIGTPGTQTAIQIAGISGVTVAGGATVVVNSSGQLGVASSSRRFKQDIQPMADASDKLMLLEPVTFRYKPEVAESRDLQYGLIAEQVAAVYPELAVYNKDGQVETLQYQQLPALLLNEIQKQHKTIADLQSRIAALEEELKAAAPANH